MDPDIAESAPAEVLEHALERLEREDLIDLVLALAEEVRGTEGILLRMAQRYEPGDARFTDDVHAGVGRQTDPDDLDDLTLLAARVQRDLPRSAEDLEWWEICEVGEEALDIGHALQDAVEGMGMRGLTLARATLTRVIALHRSCPDAESREYLDDAVRASMDAHAIAVAGASWLSAADREQIVTDLVSLVTDPDLPLPDVVAYGPVLGADGVDRLRAEARGPGVPRSDLDLALAILDRDEAAIVSATGMPSTRLEAMDLVRALERAGLTGAALRHAEAALDLPPTQWGSDDLVDFLVVDAESRGEHGRIVELRLRAATESPSRSRLGRACDAVARARAAADGGHEALADTEKALAEAERALARDSVTEYVHYLLDSQRVDDAWEYAVEHDVEMRIDLSARLCRARAESDPNAALTRYRDLVTQTLRTAHRSNYHTAADLLSDMSRAATLAGPQARQAFAGYVRGVREANRRRPACLAILAASGFVG